jgi:hypothetical protein
LSTVSSIFSQILKLIPRGDFDAAIRKHQAERNAKGFSCWGQLVAMLFCQLGSVNSLRDITNGLAASEGKLRHLGLPEAPKRSTLAYANAHRPCAVYEDLFYCLLESARGHAQQAGARHKFRFKNKLLSIDATTPPHVAQSTQALPFAAARVAVQNPSHSARPGSLMCTCVSTSPGSMTRSPKSCSASEDERSLQPRTLAIRPSSTASVAGFIPSGVTTRVERNTCAILSLLSPQGEVICKRIGRNRRIRSFFAAPSRSRPRTCALAKGAHSPQSLCTKEGS